MIIGLSRLGLFQMSKINDVICERERRVPKNPGGLPRKLEPHTDHASNGFLEKGRKLHSEHYRLRDLDQPPDEPIDRPIPDRSTLRRPE